MANLLADQSSPYLLQHAENPVDWRPWGDDALREAAERDVPLIVSIGYSACHWCHVMERECFEDDAIAGLMNERFVNVKVDREERPDVDAIYMEFVQATTGHGGWPLNVFISPDGVPLYGGTYYPPQPRQGMPSWPQVVEAVSIAWKDKRADFEEQAPRVVARLQGAAALQPSSEPIVAASLDAAVEALGKLYDRHNGGFGRAPKFPPTSAIEFLLGRGEREMSLGTLRAMARGGIHDQVGGGFARYAVDHTWTVPHFEKMLYDNGLLARAYVHGWQVSGDELLRRTAEHTLDWVLREMRAPEGGFYSALDADSEGVEGKYYVWTAGELREALGGRADDAIAYFGATGRGNFEGANVLEGRGEPPEDLDAIRATLLEIRGDRVPPALDDKRLTSWNALMIAALADAGAVFERDDYLDAARGAADFLLREMRDDEGRLLRAFNRGRAHLLGLLEDHAYLVEALLALYEATFEPRWFHAARETADAMIARFADDERGGFFSTPSDGERLVARRKELEDTPIPAGQSSAALGLLRLAALTGEHEYERRAVDTLRLAHELAPQHPHAFGHLLQAIDFSLSPVREVALVGDDVAALERVVRSEFRPHVVLAGGEPDGVPLLADRPTVDGRATAYVCERFACQAPVTDPADLERQLSASAFSPPGP
jgi:uncharacterized protein YyaL (SSP411 family)